MSFSRFGWDSDVYVFEHVGGFIQCCGCNIPVNDHQDELFGMYDAKTPREMLAHLDEHEAIGDNVRRARENIIAEYVEDLDVEIQPYVMSEEQQKQLDQFWRKIQENE